jgi:hypothetical protein
MPFQALDCLRSYFIKFLMRISGVRKGRGTKDRAISAWNIGHYVNIRLVLAGH